MVAIGKNLPPIEQNYQYGQYGQHSGIGKLGGLTLGRPREVGAVATGETGAHIPTSIGRVDDGQGNMISLGSSQGVGLAYVDPSEKNFWVA